MVKGQTYAQLFKQIEDAGGKVEAQLINGNLMEVSRSTKKRDSFIKVAVVDNIANNFINVKPDKVGFIVLVDREHVEKAHKNEK